MFFIAYACPNTNGKGKEDKNTTIQNATSNVTTPIDSNGFLKVSPSQGNTYIFYTCFNAI